MKTLFVTIFVLFATITYASQKAITDTGDEVILNDDGTWQLSDSSKKAIVPIKVNKKAFNKSSDSTFLLKSVKNNSAYWVNTTKWSFKKSSGSAETEYEFQLKGEDLYAMTVAEGIEISLEALTDIALENAKSAAPDAKIIKKEYRMVNGKKVIYMEISGTIQSIKFTYLGYYYSDKFGSTQLITYTSTNLVNKYKPEIYKLLNGLTTQ